MAKYGAARFVIISLFLIIFGFGIAALRSGEIRSRGFKFNRDGNPVGYWFTVLVNLVGAATIIYLMMTV